MEQLTFGSFFGDFNNIAPKKEEKPAKAEKKATKAKTADGEKKKSNGKNFKFARPLTVIGTNFKEVFDGEGEIKASEIIEALIEKGYDEIKSSAKCLYGEEGSNTCYVCLVSYSSDVSSDAETVVSFPTTFAFGQKKVVMNREDFPSVPDDEEVTLDDVKEFIISSMPEFSKAKLLFDPTSNIIVADKIEKIEEVTNATFILGDEERVIEGTVEDKNYREVLDLKSYSVGLLPSLEENKFFVIVEKSGGGYFCPAKFKANPDGKKKTKEQRFKLPLTVFLTMNGVREELTPEKFNGKEKIIAEDVKAYYADKFIFFKSEEKAKGLNFTFDKMSNILSIDSTPGRRG